MAFLLVERKPKVLRRLLENGLLETVKVLCGPGKYVALLRFIRFITSVGHNYGSSNATAIQATVTNASERHRGLMAALACAMGKVGAL